MFKGHKPAYSLERSEPFHRRCHVENSIKTGLCFRTPCRKVYVNRGKAPEIFYNKNMDPILIMPGETRFEELKQAVGLPLYFISPELWNAQQEIDLEIARKGSITVVIDARKVDKVGDLLLFTLITKGYKELWGRKCKTIVSIPKGFGDIYKNNPHIDQVIEDGSVLTEDCIPVDVNNLELKWEERGQDKRLGYQNRSFVYLQNLGMYLYNRTPVYVVSEEERKWAEGYIGNSKNVVTLSCTSSQKSRSYTQSAMLKQGLKAAGFTVFDLDAKTDTGYLYSRRAASALIEKSEWFIGVDSGLLHIAGALKKRIIGLFGHTDPKILLEDYERASWVAGVCHRGVQPCWWRLDCIPGSSYQEKSNKAFVSCLDIAPAEIIEELCNRKEKESNLLVVILTYNLLEMTKKCVESIRTRHSYDLFVVDNESSDGTIEWLTTKGLDFVSVKTSVAAAQNIAIKKMLHGKYDAMILLNNDIVLRYDTIDRLVETQKRTGAWGVMATPASHVPPWAIDSCLSSEPNGVELITDIPAGSYSCTILPRIAFEKVGLFDEKFTPRYIEDNDYTLRMRLLGGKFCRDTNAPYYHVLGGVVKTNEAEEKNHIATWNKNIEYFTNKWGFPPHEHQNLDRVTSVETRPIIDQLNDVLKLRSEIPIEFWVVRNMGGFGDIILSSVIAKALKARFGDMIDITYKIPKQFHSLLAHDPSICRLVEAGDGKTPSWLHIDITDAEFNVELDEIEKFGYVRSSRAKIYLDLIGETATVTPTFYLTEEEKIFGEDLWESRYSTRRRRIAVSSCGSNKLKEWPHVERFVDLLKEKGYNVIVVDEKIKNVFPYTFREMASIVFAADFVVSPDSGISNLACSLRKKVITLFSNRNGEVFKSMFPQQMIVVQGRCPTFPSTNYCDFKTPCFGNGPHRSKENIDVPVCFRNISPERVMQTIEENDHDR
jgi:ADP-heptose:LPS heptosyltransferase/GT2 family glycosyltransferase